MFLWNISARSFTDRYSQQLFVSTISPSSTFPAISKPNQDGRFTLQKRLSTAPTRILRVPIKAGTETTVTSPTTQHQCLFLFSSGLRRGNRRGHQRQQILDSFLVTSYNCVNHERKVVAHKNAAPAGSYIQFFVHYKEGIDLGSGSWRVKKSKYTNIVKQLLMSSTLKGDDNQIENDTERWIKLAKTVASHALHGVLHML